MRHFVRAKQHVAGVGRAQMSIDDTAPHRVRWGDKDWGAGTEENGGRGPV